MQNAKALRSRMLNAKQAKVAYEISQNVIVSASPGSGKTKTLIARARHKLENIPTHKSLALITYTNAGADEIAHRLVDSEKNIFIGTIHRFCLEFILRPFGWIYGWSRPRIITHLELLKFIESNRENFHLKNNLDDLNKIKRGLDGNISIPDSWENSVDINTVAAKFFSFLQEKNSIDFNEILYRSFKIISENDFVVTSLAEKFHEILIDEFQDTTIYQYEIFKIIQQKKRCTFFIVGDEKQKILRFAGAIDNAFEKAKIDFEASVEILEITYRSTNNILFTYSALFENHPNLTNESAVKDLNCKILFKETKKANHNSVLHELITDIIDQYKFKLSDIAILSPQWRDAFEASKTLRRNFRVVGLGALPHKSISNSTFSLLRCLSKFFFSKTIKNLRAVRRNIELHALEHNISIDDNLHQITNDLINEFNNIPKDQPLKTGLYQIKTIFNDVFLQPHSAFDDIIDCIDEVEIMEWDLIKYLETLSSISGITINTIHQAKGLEYKAVILNQINENKIPHQRLVSRVNNNFIYEDLTYPNIEDGRSLLYVGISRAKVFLAILHNWKPSMFIQNIKYV